MSKKRYNFYGAVYLILRKDEKVLMLRRYNTGWMDGMYTLPAGHIEENETAQQAISREAKEEVDLDIPPESISVVHTLHRKSDYDREYFDIFLEAKDFSGEPINAETEKCDEINWFPIDNLPDNTLPYIKEVFERIAKGENYSNFGF